MEKFAMFVMVVLVSLFSMNVQAHKNMVEVKGNKLIINNHKLGMVHWKSMETILKPHFKKLFAAKGLRRVRAMTVVEMVDDVEYKNTRKRRPKDNALNGGLGTARGQAVWSVVRKYADLHKIKIHTVSIRCKKRDGKCRGVEISWSRLNFCKAEKIREAAKVSYRGDGISKSRVSVVKGTRLSRRYSKVTLYFDAAFDLDNNPTDEDEKDCLAMVNDGGRVVKTTICPVGTRREGSVCVRVKMVEKPLDPCPKGSSRVGKVCVMDTEPCPKGSSRVGKVCIQDIDEDKCPAGTEMVKGVCEPVCKKGETRKDGKCVKESALSDIEFSFGIAAGIGFLTFCPELTGNPVQFSAEAFLGIGNHIRVLAGVQSASILKLDKETSDITKARVPMMMLGLEAFASAKDLGAKGHLTRLSFGLRASALGNAEFRAPAIGGFVAFSFTKNWGIKAFAQKVFFEEYAANDLTADPKSKSTWLTGLQITYSF